MKISLLILFLFLVNPFFGFAQDIDQETADTSTTISLYFEFTIDTISKLKIHKRRGWEYPELFGSYKICNMNYEKLFINNTRAFYNQGYEFYLEVTDSCDKPYKDETWTEDIDYFKVYNPIVVSKNNCHTDTLDLSIYKFSKPGKYKIRLVYNPDRIPQVYRDENYKTHRINQNLGITIKSNWTTLVVK